MKATFLVGTLKPAAEISHTAALSEYLAEKLKIHGVESEIIRLADHDIPLGLVNDVGAGDGWPPILEQLYDSDIVILATPIWWGSYSSLIQKIIERMNSVRTKEFRKGKSPFNNKVGGVVVTGGEDGAEYVIGHLGMFLAWVGFTLPPAYSLSVLSGVNFDNGETTREALFEAYEKSSGSFAAVTAANMAALARFLKEKNIFPAA